jgi:hypothetical protein
MAVDEKNIELGEGVLQFKAYDSGLPTTPDFTAGTVYDVGASQGGTFTYKPTYKDISIGQFMSPIKSVMIGEEGSFRCKLVESKMANIALAVGMSPTALQNLTVPTRQRLTFGGYMVPVYWALQYEVHQIDDASKHFRIVLYRTKIDSGIATDFVKDNERVMEVTFKLYPASASVKDLGWIEKET